MTDIAIRAERLSKQYQIGKRLDRHATLRDQIAETLAAPVHWLRRNGHSASANLGPDSIWALKDVSFEIKRGEVVGIIGRNGAGKSTLLKILSRITEPTDGYVDIFGRVGSLLEVGTGFHPELTGRENIYLNGAILGMKRTEINRKFDEIVSFAEVEQFIDTPVKRYSSGMYVRLAFAVAAHLEPDILLVDEVLAVGDVAFQEKCLGKMGEVAHGGRTVLLVSHNLGAVQRLCSRVVVLHRGAVRSNTDPAAAVQQYMTLLKQEGAEEPRHATAEDPTMTVRVMTADGMPTLVWPFGEKLVVEVLVVARGVVHSPSIDLAFYTGARVPLFALRSDSFVERPRELVGQWRVRFEIENPRIAAPEMVFDVVLREGNVGDRKFLLNAGFLSADFKTVPKAARADSLIYPLARVVSTLGPP